MKEMSATHAKEEEVTQIRIEFVVSLITVQIVSIQIRKIEMVTWMLEEVVMRVKLFLSFVLEDHLHRSIDA